MTRSSTANSDSGLPDLRDLFFPWLPKSTPDSLVQPILPDWSLIRITETNSSAPDTERRILDGDSYGRQIGRIIDALALLIAERPADAPRPTAIRDFEALEKRIAKAKKTAAIDRLTRLRSDLELLKTSDPAAYQRELKALREVLGG